jgi:hypothetical protein
MSQSKSSGAAASRWGLKTAHSLAKNIGAKMVSERSNEGVYCGSRVTIHCAAANTDSVGATYKTLERVDHVLGAFQVTDGSFELWRLTTKDFRAQMRETRSKGAAAGRVGLVRRSVFFESGQHVANVRLSEHASTKIP